ARYRRYRFQKTQRREYRSFVAAREVLRFRSRHHLAIRFQRRQSGCASFKFRLGLIGRKQVVKHEQSFDDRITSEAIDQSLAAELSRDFVHPPDTRPLYPI